MKNIHVLPTDKPSRLAYDFYEKIYLLSEDTQFFEFQNLVQNRELYITSDKEIKEGDWFIANNGVHKCIRVDNNTSCPFITLNSKGEEIGHFKTWKTKIILTTNQDLIQDGVQAIDDEFLEWFVSKTNDSGKPIDIVEVNYGVLKPFQSKYKGYLIHFPGNEVLEEPKQETLEEAAERLYPNGCDGTDRSAEIYRRIFIEGANWQAERMYSEEDMLFAYEQGARLALLSQSELARQKGKFPTPSEWFNQFKKK